MIFLILYVRLHPKTFLLMKLMRLIGDYLTVSFKTNDFYIKI